MVERLISGGAGLLFKGSGFYITDYRRQLQTGRKEGCAEICNERYQIKQKERSRLNDGLRLRPTEGSRVWRK
jgi:hypothetical protein